MDDIKAAEILKSLATGVDPGDGASMPASRRASSSADHGFPA